MGLLAQLPGASICLKGEESAIFRLILGHTGADGLVVKNPPANAGDMGLIPGPGRSPDKEMATHSSILAWRIPWTEEPSRL